MIKAKHTRLGKLFFSYYSKWKLKKHFKEIRFVGHFDDEGLPILLIANHFSWWDGFIQLQLNEQFMHRKFHVMMLEEQLKNFIILNNGGAFSVQKNSRDLISSLQYSLDLLADKNNLLLLFPQGEIQSLHTGYLYFERGLEYLLKQAKNQIQLIFNVSLTDYFSDKKPTLTIYFKKYVPETPINLQTIEADFNQFVTTCKQQQKL